MRIVHTLAQPASRATALVFALNSFLLASFFARLPAVQGGLGLSHGALGLALTGLSVGSIAAMLTAGRLVASLSTGRVTWWAALALCLVSPLPTLAGNAVGLAAALGLLGLVNGTVAVAVNAQAAAIEARARVSMMASFHAMFSLGGIAGAAAGSLAAASGLGPSAHLLLLGSVAALATLACRGALMDGTPPEEAPGGGTASALVWPRRPLAGLALICFATMLCEGAASDWSALHLAKDLGAGPALAALGYGCFAAGMALGRLQGDMLCERLSASRVASGGALVAAVGIGCGLLLGHPLPAVLGFACLGLGLAGVVPIIFRAAGSVPGLAPGVGIAAVASVGFTGFLAGPPLIGLLAQRVGLGPALGVVPALATAVALAAPLVLGAETRPYRQPRCNGVDHARRVLAA